MIKFKRKGAKAQRLKFVNLYFLSLNLCAFAPLRLIFILALVCSCSKAPKPKRPPPNVSTAVVEQREVPIYIDAIGQVIPPVEVQIRPQVQGKLLEAYVKQGAIVKEGDVLYKIDPRPFQATLDEAKAQLTHDEALLAIAEKTMERYKTVVEQDFISQLTWEQYVSSAEAAKAQVELDKASIRAAEINLNYCDVVAPISGKISYFNTYPGDVAVAYDTTAITTIRPFNPIDITFSLPQQYFELIRREQGDAGKWPFVASLPENPKATFEGKSYFIDNQIDQNTGTILLKGRFSNVKRELWPGEFVKVKVLQKSVPNALLVPPGAILIGKDGPYLYSMSSDKKVSPHNVDVLTRTEEYIAFASKDLKKGDIVITDGQINIAPGMVVNPVKK